MDVDTLMEGYNLSGLFGFIHSLIVKIINASTFPQPHSIPLRTILKLTIFPVYLNLTIPSIPNSNCIPRHLYSHGS